MVSRRRDKTRLRQPGRTCLYGHDGLGPAEPHGQACGCRAPEPSGGVLRVCERELRLPELGSAGGGGASFHPLSAKAQNSSSTASAHTIGGTYSAKPRPSWIATPSMISDETKRERRR